MAGRVRETKSATSAFSGSPLIGRQRAENARLNPFRVSTGGVTRVWSRSLFASGATVGGAADCRSTVEATPT
jgi:hypothetical protein